MIRSPARRDRLYARYIEHHHHGAVRIEHLANVWALTMPEYSLYWSKETAKGTTWDSKSTVSTMHVILLEVVA